MHRTSAAADAWNTPLTKGILMTQTDWIYKFRRLHSLETLDKLYEHLCYTVDASEQYAMTQAWDHRKAELAAGKLFDRVPATVWRYVQ